MTAPTYRTTGDWGAGKGANLTPGEIDLNFYGLDTRVTYLEDNPPTPVEISNVAQAGSQITFHLEDGTTFGPFTLPRSRFASRGDWTAAETYFVNDVVRVRGMGLYLVLENHVADSAFDPDAVNGSAEPLYEFMISLSSEVKTFAGDSSGTFDLVAADIGKYIRLTDAGGTAVVVPDDADTDLPVGCEYHFRQASGGAVTFTPGSTDVSILPPDGFDAEISGAGGVVTIKKVLANTWEIFGMLAEDSSAT